MDEEKILKYMGGLDVELHCHECVDSTNLLAKEWVRAGGKLPAVFIANKQTAGRGRLGRSFISPKGGLYMSLAFDCTGIVPGSLTTLGAVCVLRSAQKLGMPQMEIKWVNDLMQKGKKVGGILAEGLRFSGGRISQAVIGIGLNAGKVDFPKELAMKAAGVDFGEEMVDIEKLAALMIEDFLKGLSHMPEHMSIYRSHCLTIGQQICFESDGVTIFGKALDVNDEGVLIVKTQGGTIEVAAGEVSVRSAQGEYV